MRIIAGTHRGRQLLSPKGTTTRPITDRVKQSLFDRLSAAGQIEELAILDLFSGTGSLGIECLSRGAGHVTFVELDREAGKLLGQNLDTLKETAKARLLATNILSATLEMMLPRRDYALIFADPPYPMVRNENEAPRLWTQLERIGETSTTADAWLVLRAEEHETPPVLKNWREPETFEYGSMSIHIYHAQRADREDHTQAPGAEE